MLRWPLSGFPNTSPRLSAPSRQSRDILSFSCRRGGNSQLHRSTCQTKAKNKTKLSWKRLSLSSASAAKPGSAAICRPLAARRDVGSCPCDVVAAELLSAPTPRHEMWGSHVLILTPGLASPWRATGAQGIGGVDSNRGLARWLPERVHVSSGPPKSVLI